MAPLKPIQVFRVLKTLIKHLVTCSVSGPMFSVKQFYREWETRKNRFRRREHVLTQRWSRVHEAWNRGVRDGPCTSRMYLCWAFFIMGPLLEDRSMTSETQIMTGRVARMLVSLKEYPGC